LVSHYNKRFSIAIDGISDKDPPTKDHLIILVVGDKRHWATVGNEMPLESYLAFAEYHNVSKELLKAVNPDIVLSPLLCPSFDCLDLAQTLENIGFKGRFRVMTPKLPKPEIVAAEIRNHCPSINFEFILTRETKKSRLN